MPEITVHAPEGDIVLPVEEKQTEQPKLSRKEIGELRRRYMTVEHSAVNKCGHKLDTNHQPKDNCPDCWEAYFKVGLDLAEVQKVFGMEDGAYQLERKFGKKFVKRFKQFLHDELMALAVAPPSPEEALKVATLNEVTP